MLTKRQLAAQQVGRSNRRHGAHGTPEYGAWANLKDRCQNPRSKQYSRYGGRGITVCERWKSFENFYADMGARPSLKHSIDRIDNDGPYSPENCRWADGSRQQRNKSNTITVDWRGSRVSVTDLAEAHGLAAPTVMYRLRRGWSVEDAVRPVDRMIALSASDGATGGQP